MSDNKQTPAQPSVDQEKIEAAIRKAINKPEGELNQADFDKVTELDLRSNQLIDVKGLENLTQLTKLDLYINKISDISSLCNLKQLTHLDLQDNCLTNDQLKFLEEFSELTFIALGRNNLDMLPDFSKLPKLHELGLFMSKFADLSPIAVCKNLKIIDLRNFTGPDKSVFNALEGLALGEVRWGGEYTGIGIEEELERLAKTYGERGQDCDFINDADVESPAWTRSFNSLNMDEESRTIAIIECAFNEAAQYTKEVTTLDLGGNKINDAALLISSLKKFLNSEFLLSGEIRNDYLKELTQLTGLNLSYNQLTDVQGLENLTQLTGLNLSSNQLTDVQGLENLTQLTSLDLSRNEISDVTPLKELTPLTELDLSFNEISDVTPLKKFKQLTKLNLYGNKIIDVTPLKELTQLTELKLENNPISDMAPLKELIQLMSLKKIKTKIRESIEKPEGELTQADFDQVTELDLSFSHLPADREISDVSPLINLTQLTELNLSFNEISDVTPLKELTQLTKLDLTDNQISEADIETLKAALPNCEIKHE